MMVSFQCASLGLTFLLLLLHTLGPAHGALLCKEDNSDAQQSVKLTTKTKPSKASANTYEHNTIRSYKTFSPIVTRWKPSRSVSVPTYVPSESTNHKRIMVPVGVSNYRPVQYIDSYKPKPFPHEYFDKVMASYANKTSTTSTTEATVNNTVAASSDINEVKVNEGGADLASGRAHPPRFIELESSYVPLTIRFPSRTSKLNIIPGDNDLVGQDSNRLDSFGRRTTASGSHKADNSRRIDLDTRVIFGEEKRDEPLVLKQGAKSQIPSNMKNIIKCIFPDFHFEGDDKVQSAC